MARFVAVVLLLTLALAPAVSAEPESRGESPFSGWLDAFWGALDRVFSWVPTIRSEPRKHGAFIEPSGVHGAPGRSGAYIDPSGVTAAPRKNGAYIEPSGIQSVAREHGAYIEPSGIRAVPGALGNPGLRGSAAIRQIH